MKWAGAPRHGAARPFSPADLQPIRVQIMRHLTPHFSAASTRDAAAPLPMHRQPRQRPASSGGYCRMRLKHALLFAPLLLALPMLLHVMQATAQPMFAEGSKIKLMPAVRPEAHSSSIKALDAACAATVITIAAAVAAGVVDALAIAPATLPMIHTFAAPTRPARGGFLVNVEMLIERVSE